MQTERIAAGNASWLSAHRHRNVAIEQRTTQLANQRIGEEIERGIDAAQTSSGIDTG